MFTSETPSRKTVHALRDMKYVTHTVIAHRDYRKVGVSAYSLSKLGRRWLREQQEE